MVGVEKGILTIREHLKKMADDPMLCKFNNDFFSISIKNVYQLLFCVSFKVSKIDNKYIWLFTSESVERVC